MLVAHDAVNTETRLVANAEPALAEDVEGLRLGGQHYFAQPLVPCLGPRHLVDDHLRRVLTFDRHAQAVANLRRTLHHARCERDATLRLRDLNRHGISHTVNHTSFEVEGRKN
jgi:hypothetical protein